MSQVSKGKGKAVNYGCFLISVLHSKAAMNYAPVKNLFPNWAEGHPDYAVNHKEYQPVGFCKAGLGNCV